MKTRNLGLSILQINPMLLPYSARVGYGFILALLIIESLIDPLLLWFLYPCWRYIWNIWILEMLYYEFKLYFISFHAIYKFCETSYPVCIQLGSANLNIVNKIFFWNFKHTCRHTFDLEIYHSLKHVVRQGHFIDCFDHHLNFEVWTCLK